MDCNKDEAARAKEISEKKFAEKDLRGAKKFALKAQKLYPGLDGLKQMLATLDVYLSAENKIGGEPDWYGVIGVSHDAGNDMIRKQYRKMALLLHPDKNKSLGADGAFNILSEAWNLLSDKNRKASYDYKRQIRASIEQCVLRSSQVPAAASTHNTVSSPLCTIKPHKTFWTKVSGFFTDKSKNSGNADGHFTGKSQWFIVKSSVAVMQFWKGKLDNLQKMSSRR